MIGKKSHHARSIRKRTENLSTPLCPFQSVAHIFQHSVTEICRALSLLFHEIYDGMQTMNRRLAEHQVKMMNWRKQGNK
jgi:hypothetical protein